MTDVHVAEDWVGDWRVSTVRLPLDHGWPGYPLWYETMVFPRRFGNDPLCWRYATAKEARLGHALVVSELQAGKEPRAITREDSNDHSIREPGGSPAAAAAGERGTGGGGKPEAS